MVFLDVFRSYVDRMCSSVSGLKLLLLDVECAAMVSLVFTHSELIALECVLIESLLNFNDRQPMPHLKCIVFCRPSEENIALLRRELKMPFFGEYFLHFSNFVTREQLRELAEADDKQIVAGVEEIFLDVYALTPFVFSCEVTPDAVGKRTVDGLISSLLAMKRCPSTIRFQKSSKSSLHLAHEVARVIHSETDLFHFTHPPCHLLILDRIEDPLTPLILPWTYQAMIHEHLRLDRNRCEIRPTDVEQSDASDRNENIHIFSPHLDPFYSRNMFSHWGDLCANVKQFVESFQKSCSLTELRTSGSIADLKTAMSQLPDARKVGSAVAKHVTVVSEIGTTLRQRDLFRLGVFEQDMAVNQNHTDHWEQLIESIRDLNKKSNSNKHTHDILRLSLIYILRYEKHSNFNLTKLIEILLDNGLTEAEISKLKSFQERFGISNRMCNTLLFPQKSKLLKIVLGAVKGMDQETSVYTQHEPILKQIVHLVAKGQLSNEMFPSIQNFSSSPQHYSAVESVPEVIVFYVGGATYAEAALIHHWNENQSTPNDRARGATASSRIILGTTCMLNTQQFMEKF